MCLGIPVKIIKIDGDMAMVEAGGLTKNVGLQLMDNIKVGDYVLLHAGFVLQKIDEDEAKETLRLLEEISEVS